MKPHHLILLLSTLMLACTSPADKTKPSRKDSAKTAIEPAPIKLDNVWHEDFLVLQKALAESDKKGLKEFIDFPIMSVGNDIWHLVDVNGTMNIPSGKAKPFTEADYDKYHPILFTYNLPPAIKRINTEELFKEKSTTTSELIDKKGVKTRLEVKYDPSADRLTLRLITRNDEWSFTRFYHFNVKDGKIKFQTLVVSG